MGVLCLWALNFGGDVGGKSSVRGFIPASSGVHIRQCVHLGVLFFIINTDRKVCNPICCRNRLQQMNADYMYEKGIPESCLRAYFLITSRWHLAIVIYQSHAIDPVCCFSGSQTQYVVIILQSVSTILICCSLMQKAKGLLLQLVAKSIVCSLQKYA